MCVPFDRRRSSSHTGLSRHSPNGSDSDYYRPQRRAVSACSAVRRHCCIDINRLTGMSFSQITQQHVRKNLLSSAVCEIAYVIMKRRKASLHKRTRKWKESYSLSKNLKNKCFCFILHILIIFETFVWICFCKCKLFFVHYCFWIVYLLLIIIFIVNYQ